MISSRKLQLALLLSCFAGISTGHTQTGFAFPDGSPTINVNGVEVLRTTGTGRVGIGTSNPTTTLEVSGTVSATSFVGNGCMPAGAIVAFASTTCPTGWTEYTAARGRFLRGIDNGAGNDPGGTRSPGNVQADAMQQITGSMGFNRTAAANLVGAFSTGGSPGPSGASVGASAAGSVAFDSADSPGARTATETRPKNVAVTFCQKN